MKFMTIVKSAEGQGTPPPSLFGAIAQLGEEGVAAGVFVRTGGLLPTANGARVELRGGQISVSDGPFSEAKEVIGGYAFYEVETKEEAIEWSVRFLELHKEHWPGWEGEVEVREVEVDFDPAAWPAENVQANATA